MRKAIAVMAVALTFVGACHLYKTTPPDSGTVMMKGSHPKKYSSHDIVACNNAYYLGIRSDDGNRYTTWYVPIEVYAKYEIGDRVGHFGKKR